MYTIAIINQKGGVAKTTTAHAVAAGLSLKGFNVLMVDADGQKSLTSIAGANRDSPGLYDVLMRQARPAEAITTTDAGAIMPASAALGSIEAVLRNTGREYRLKEALKEIEGHFDFCIVDGPPSLGTLAVNALTACNACIIPAQADFLSLQAIDQLGQTLEAVRAYTNKSLEVLGVLITRYNARAIISREVSDLMRERAEQIKTKVFKTKIRECVAIKEAQALRQSIFNYAPRSNGAKDYISLIGEILETIKKGVQ